jgi:hypothetical protein
MDLTEPADFKAELRVVDGVTWMRAADAHLLVALELRSAMHSGRTWLVCGMVGGFVVGVLTGMRWEALWR